MKFYVIFQKLTFLHQNLTAYLKILGPLSENNCPRRYVVISFFGYINYIRCKRFAILSEGNLWRHIGKMENFGEIWWSSLSLCIISVFKYNLNFTRKFHSKVNVNQKLQILSNVTLKIRSLTVSAYSSYFMLPGNYSSQCRNLWRSAKYDWFVSSSIGCYIEIAKLFWYTLCYRRKKRQIWNLLSEEKKQ